MYFLCLSKCFRKYLLKRGFIVSFPNDVSGKYLIPVEIQGKPEGELQNCVNGSIILANNDQYNFKGQLIEPNYIGLYKNGVEFFTVQQSKNKASLKLVSKDEAEKLHSQLPNKMVGGDVFTDPVVLKERRTAAMVEEFERTRPEREYQERIAEIKSHFGWWIEHPELDNSYDDFY